MDISGGEFLTLSREISDREVKIANLETEVDKVKADNAALAAERDMWREKYEATLTAASQVELENIMLKNYLWLSWSKIRNFVAHVSDIRLVAFLQTFMQKTVSDSMGGRALESINDVVELPDENRVNNITLNDATFQGPMYDVRGNDNVNLGGGMNG